MIDGFTDTENASAVVDVPLSGFVTDTSRRPSVASPATLALTVNSVADTNVESLERAEAAAALIDIDVEPA